MEFNKYEQALGYVRSINHTTRQGYLNSGLKRINKLLELLDNPHKKFHSIHVGGTSGKGSTSTMISCILKEAGYKTGLHVSPHLEDIRERMQIDNKMITRENFIELVNILKPGIEKMKSEYDEEPTYFEALVALAFLHFSIEKVDIAVIEVGLGGLLDGTNVIMPEVAVLTNVSLDHTEILGDTVEKIAQDKVGIFKQNIPVITCVQQPSVIQIVESSAKDKNCPLYRLGDDFNYEITESNLKGSIFNFKSKDKNINNIRILAIGKHQVENASLAIQAINKLKNFKIEERHIKEALSKILIQGRFEIINKDPLTIIDGAHNPAKILSLTSTLKNIFPESKISFIISLKKGKDIKEIMKEINPLAKKIYATSFSQDTDFAKHTSINPEEIAKHSKVPSEIIINPFEAYEKAKQEASKEDIICITGSLYLVGEIRKKFVKDKIDLSSFF